MSYNVGRVFWNGQTIRTIGHLMDILERIPSAHIVNPRDYFISPTDVEKYPNGTETVPLSHFHVNTILRRANIPYERTRDAIHINYTPAVETKPETGSKTITLDLQEEESRIVLEALLADAYAVADALTHEIKCNTNNLSEAKKLGKELVSLINVIDSFYKQT